MESIIGDTKLIFILFPETKAYIEEKLKLKDPAFLSLLMAMKQKVSYFAFSSIIHQFNNEGQIVPVTSLIWYYFICLAKI